MRANCRKSCDCWLRTRANQEQIYETGKSAAPDMLHRGKNWAKHKLKDAAESVKEAAQDTGDAIEQALNHLMQKFR